MNVQERRREALERDRREMLLAQAGEDLAALETIDLVEVVSVIRVRRAAPPKRVNHEREED